MKSSPDLSRRTLRPLATLDVPITRPVESLIGDIVIGHSRVGHLWRDESFQNITEQKRAEKARSE